MQGPNPDIKHPIPMHPRVGFLRPLVDAANVEIGDFTYYDDPDGPEHFVDKCVLHYYDFIGDRLVIGRFCAIAEGARFIMNGANHAMSGFSTYPFNIFGHGWEEGFDPRSWERELRGDTVIASLEQMFLHVDMKAGKACPAAPEVLALLMPIAKAHEALARPEAAGRHVGQRR